MWDFRNILELWRSGNLSYHHAIIARGYPIPTKTPTVFGQSLASDLSFRNVFFQVFLTREDWSALLPYFFLFVSAQSIASLLFTVFSHLFVIFASGAGPFSPITLSFLSFHIRCVDSVIIILYSRFLP